jgi:hypothetical protein
MQSPVSLTTYGVFVFLILIELATGGRKCVFPEGSVHCACMPPIAERRLVFRATHEYGRLGALEFLLVFRPWINGVRIADA